MSDFHNEALRKLAKRSNAEQMNSVDSFVQGFIMGRNFQSEFITNLYNSTLQQMNATADFKFSEDNWWDKEIERLGKENFELKSKYVWPEEE